MSPFLKIGLPILAVVLAIVFFTMSFVKTKEVWGAIRSPKWPTAEATIIGSRIAEKKGEETSTYHPIVAYEFRVEESVYSGTDENQSGFATEQEARGYTEKFPKGGALTVHYHPKKPSKSLVNPGWKPSNNLSAVFAPVFLLLGIACVSFLRKFATIASVSEKNRDVDET